MGRLARAVVVLCSLAVIGAAFLLWDATGRRWWTMYYDPARQAQPGGDSLAELFEDEGVAPLEEAPNEFRFGMLPSGSDRHLVSVAAFAGPAALAAIAALVPGRRRHAPPGAPAQRDASK